MLRPAADRCPGLLRLHLAADGALVRIKVPGGRMTGRAWQVVAGAAARFGDGDVALTGRGGLQIRGIRPGPGGAAPDELVGTVVAAGLLPSRTHDRVRSILCSPLTGRVGGRADLRPVVDRLDALLCADPELAALSGRFLFTVDDRGDLAGLPGDLGVRALDRGTVRLRIGALAGERVPVTDAAAALVALAHRFLAVRGDAWQVRDLPGRGVELGGRPLPAESAGTADPAPAPGLLVQRDGHHAVVALAPLGLVDPARSAAVVRAAAAGGDRLVVTPWRSVVVADLPAGRSAEVLDTLGAAGWVVDPASGWRGVTACTGAPGCVRSAGDTRTPARSLAAARRPTDLPVHVVGCERRCGVPAGPHRELRVTG
ncbi:cobalamin biosynthesis protein CobG [Nakamurella endophytica]|nr:cobalamin biosynthesis protein CobG [Nakamurella endophytica]